MQTGEFTLISILFFAACGPLALHAHDMITGVKKEYSGSTGNPMKRFRVGAMSFLFLIKVGIIDAQTIGLFYDFSRTHPQFAAGDIKATLEDDGFNVEETDLNKVNKRYKNGKIVIS